MAVDEHEKWVKTRSGHRDKNVTTWVDMGAWAEHGA